MEPSCDLDDLQLRLLRSLDEESFQLLKRAPNDWIANHAAAITSFTSSASRDLLLRDDIIQNILFPKTFLFAASIFGKSEDNIKELKALVNFQRAQNVITRLGNYRNVKNKLHRLLLPDGHTFPRSVGMTNQHEADDQHEKLRTIFDGAMQYDAVHLAAIVLSCLSDPGLHELLLSKKDETLDQDILDLLQGLLDHPAMQLIHPQILRALIHLSKEAALFPRCLVHNEVKVHISSQTDHGSFGYVLQGSLGQQRVAVKVMRQRVGYMDMAPIIRNFSREALFWSQLRHPNILPFYGIYFWPEPTTASTRLCLLSPWVENGNLVEFLEKNKSADRISMILDIANGLGYLHGQDPPFIHGDLKGNNILVTSSGTACLADFGLGRLERDETVEWRASTALDAGPLLFTAPELLGTDEDLPSPIENVRMAKTTKSDIYAFACLCYEIYNVIPRFADIKNQMAVIKAIQKNRPCKRPRSMANNLLWDFLTRMWQPAPEKRPTIADFLKAFQNAAADSQSFSSKSDWDRGPVARLRSLTLLAPATTPEVLPHLAHQQAVSQLSLNTVDTVGSETTMAVNESPTSYEFSIVHQPVYNPPQSTARPTLPVEIIPNVKGTVFGENDIIIALMGPTGTGKSTFINRAMGMDVARVTSGLGSSTKDIEIFGCYHPDNRSQRVFFVDTPGFENTTLKDRDVLKMIAQWLQNTFKCRVLLSGVLYFHWINQARMSGSRRANLEIFTEMCGKDAMKNVVIVSTGWEELDNEEDGLIKEKRLLDTFLAKPMSQGCRYLPFIKRDSEAAWDIIDLFTEQRRALQIQVEMGLWKRWNQTSAYRAFRQFSELFRKQRE